MVKRYLNLTLKNSLGFTLVEALISVAIVSIIGLMVTTLLARTFESNTKTRLLGIVKQNGQNALNFMDNAIRQADSVVCVGNGSTGSVLPDDQTAPANYVGDTIVVKNSNTYTRIQILATSSVNGSIRTDAPLWNDTKTTEYKLCDTSPNPLTSQMLVNTDSGIAVNLSSTKPFTLNRVVGPKDVVQIYFELRSTGSNTDFENSIVGNQIFQTTVVLR